MFPKISYSREFLTLYDIYEKSHSSKIEIDVSMRILHPQITRNIILFWNKIIISFAPKIFLSRFGLFYILKIWDLNYFTKSLNI